MTLFGDLLRFRREPHEAICVVNRNIYSEQTMCQQAMWASRPFANMPSLTYVFCQEHLPASRRCASRSCGSAGHLPADPHCAYAIGQQAMCQQATCQQAITVRMSSTKKACRQQAICQQAMCQENITPAGYVPAGCVLGRYYDQWATFQQAIWASRPAHQE
jgi:hypothetical protein